MWEDWLTIYDSFNVKRAHHRIDVVFYLNLLSEDGLSANWCELTTSVWLEDYHHYHYYHLPTLYTSNTCNSRAESSMRQSMSNTCFQSYIRCQCRTHFKSHRYNIKFAIHMQTHSPAFLEIKIIQSIMQQWHRNEYVSISNILSLARRMHLPHLMRQLRNGKKSRSEGGDY